MCLATSWAHKRVLCLAFYQHCLLQYVKICILRNVQLVFFCFQSTTSSHDSSPTCQPTATFSHFFHARIDIYRGLVKEKREKKRDILHSISLCKSKSITINVLLASQMVSSKKTLQILVHLDNILFKEKHRCVYSQFFIRAQVDSNSSLHRAAERERLGVGSEEIPSLSLFVHSMGIKESNFEVNNIISSQGGNQNAIYVGEKTLTHCR